MHRKFYLLILLFSICYAGTAQFNGIFKKKRKKKPVVEKVEEFKGKIWEPGAPVSMHYEEQGFKAVFQKSFNSNNKDKTWFRAFVKNTKKSSSATISISFDGPCTKQVILESPLTSYTADIDKFKESRNVEDLPIDGPLKAIIKGLKEQCNQLETVLIRISYDDNIPPRIMMLHTGTLEKANNWKLKNGFNSYDENYKIEISTHQYKTSSEAYYTPATKLIAVHYNGPCEAKAKLHIAPFFANNELKRNYKRGEYLTNFRSAAEDAIKQYTKQCPEVEEINFTLDYTPFMQKCKEGKECMLRSSKATSWGIDDTDFSFTGYDGPRLSTYTDVIRQLEKKDFEPLGHYDGLFKLFYTDFLIAYGDNCKNLLKNPVEIITILYEQYTDSNGFKSNKEQIGEPGFAYIDKNDLSMYKKFERANKSTIMSGLFNDALYGNTGDTFTRQVGAAKFLNNEISGKCSSPKVQGIYKTMKELAAEME